MAYRIAVLDDDIKELDRTAKMLSFYGERRPQYELEITCFQEIKPFMEAVCSGDGKEGQAFDILIMDVELPEGDGVEAASLLREKGFDGVIIFQSRTADHALAAYGVNALQYLIKPVSRERLARAMERAVKESSPCPVLLASKRGYPHRRRTEAAGAKRGRACGGLAVGIGNRENCPQ